MIAHRSVFRRRLRIAREQLGDELVRFADAVGRAQADATLFESIFPMLRMLNDELGDAVRESKLRSQVHQHALIAAQRAAHHLLVVAHHGKDLALQLEEGLQPGPELEHAARTLAKALKQGVATEAPTLMGRAAEAWERARAAEGAFLVPGTARTSW